LPLTPLPPRTLTPSPYTTLFRSRTAQPTLRRRRLRPVVALPYVVLALALTAALAPGLLTSYDPLTGDPAASLQAPSGAHWFGTEDRKSTRLNSSHVSISYAVFCL